VAKLQQKGTVGAVCRGQGVFVGASATIFERTIDPEVLESLAVSEALSLGTYLLKPRVLVVSDCLNVIKELKSPPEMGQNCMIIRF
jgi:hypothetical protein